MSFTAASSGIQGVTAPAAPPLDPAILGGEVVPTDDGGAEIYEAAEDTPPVEELDHDANLAAALDDSVLTRLAAEVIEGVEADIQSNAENYRIFEEGMKLLGLKPGVRLDKPYAGSSASVHPLLKEAMAHFAATAMGEMLPASGPVRTQVNGDGGPAIEARADRKQNYMNYFLTEVDEDYYPDYDQMCMMLGFYGSMFRMVWRDPLRAGWPTSRFLTPYDLVVSYSATGMADGSPITHIEPVSQAEMRRLQLKGWYLDLTLAIPDGTPPPAMQSKERADFRSPTDRPEDAEHVVYHRYCMIDLEGLEHEGANGEPSGLPLPYVVSVDRDSQKVIRVARNYKQGDPEFRLLDRFVHYRYMPGLGFMGWGLVHLVGDVTDTLSVLRRQALNSFTMSTFPGGVRVKGAKMENMDTAIGPCEFPEIDTGGLPIQQALMSLPYKDLPPAYSLLVQEVLTSGQRVGSVSDMAVGDGREDALPGTVIALIEKATKLESSVIKRMHVAQRKELRLLADLMGADPQAKYPWRINGQQGVAIGADFADNAEIVPVSDPNIPTRTERLAQSQAKLTMAQQSGGVMDIRAATEDMLRTMGSTDADVARLMPPAPQGQPADPVTEFTAAMKGMPLAVGPAQNHEAHIQAHMGQLSSPIIAKLPASVALQAHIADHLAAFYTAQVQRMTGIPVAPGQPMQPAQEAQVSMAVAQATEVLKAAMAALAPPGDPSHALDAMKLQLEQLKLEISKTDSDRKAQETARQDQVEMFKLKAEATEGDKQRAADIRIAELNLEAARVSAGQRDRQAQLDHVAEVAGHVLTHDAELKGHDATVEAAKHKKGGA